MKSKIDIQGFEASFHEIIALNYFGKNIETHGSLYLKRRGVIEISSIRVGDAIIKGRIKGNVHAMGTVEIFKHGEIYGKITCSKLIVNKGGVFSGNVEMLDVQQNQPETE